ncbi:sarcosine oxidase [Acinetobacter qingfengensis]|uniref:Sarcosine oxidase n=1 Tax=Acinetobacter qingfengensis TaxID=1262585 RepID=A0A1E7RES5_9GAMM|nr:sarcosine oxidase subunit gamma family protein [Acinetobacter qingfengensis]KAA8735030.1 sarcosine oxidase [Acinetobacter qingfengensis]OEY97752.1 sarcosine oxidase [Acinetobacter qingfengensis]
MQTEKILQPAERSPIANIKALNYKDFGRGKSFLDQTTASDKIIQQCALVDLTNLARVGFRGTDSAAYLQNLGYQLPETANTAVQQSNGEWLARLSATEYLILGTLNDFGVHVTDIEQNWQMTEQGNYLLPRQDSHAWLQISGQYIVDVMAKLCGVDLSPAAFISGQVAQTSVARINCIVINASTDIPKFYMLCDRASALYLWHVILDAMTEFEGQVVGVNTLI